MPKNSKSRPDAYGACQTTAGGARTAWCSLAWPGPAGARMLHSDGDAKYADIQRRNVTERRHQKCLVARMESVPYQAKRAHWGMTWFAIKAFRAAAVEQAKTELAHMTPARFDILFLIEQRYYGPRVSGVHPKMHLSEITERLGLSASTISKTVTGMVKHGLVQRFDDHVDARRVLVALTDFGEKAYLSALAMLRTDRILREKLEAILTTLGQAGQPRMSVDEHRANGVEIQHQKLRAIARGYQYWADDLYEPYFDGSVDSPLQHVFDELRSRRARARRGKPTHRREIALWEFWGAPRPFRRSAHASASD